MDVNEKQKVNELKQFLGSIPADDVEVFRNQLIAKVKSNRTIFRNWALGITRVPILERSLMNELAIEKYNRIIFIEQ